MSQGLNAIGSIAFLFISGVALLLAVVLGAFAWVTASRAPVEIGRIVGQGLLGLFAVISFTIGGLSLVIGLESAAGSRATGWAFVVLFLAPVLFAGEFSLLGRLYGRAHAQRPRPLARGLKVASYAAALISGVAACLVLIFGVISLIVPEGPTGEVRGYQRGCAASNGSDCNMFGLRLQTGDKGLPRDPAKAVEAFKKGCDLRAAIACWNLARLYREGDGINKNPELAAEYAARGAALDAAP